MLNKLRLVSVSMIIVISTGSMLSFGTPALACSCVSSYTPQEAGAKSDAVFEGTVTAVKSLSMSLLSSTDKEIKANFQVNEVWKGHVAPNLEVHTSMSSCGYEFKTGERYLVYATATGKSLQVNLCNGTVLHSQAGEHIAQLGSGSLPPQVNAGEQQTGETFVRNIIILLSVIIAISAAILLYRRNNLTRS
jgi:hypothetical protein